MCRGNLQYFGDCGHEKSFHPTEICSYYSPDAGKCLGILTILHQTVIHSPAICIGCAVRIEASMKSDRDDAIRGYEEKIKTLVQAMSKAKDTQAYHTMETQRAEVVKALAEFVEAQNEELTRFQKKQGKNAPGRAVDLAHDWYNDEETDSDQGRESPHGSCDGERSIGPGHVARREMRDEAEDPCRLMTPFDDRWNDDDLLYE